MEHDRTCDALGPPPAIATCIAGAARSFGTPLVQGHLRRNLVEALGGSDGSRLFLLLKTLDSNKFVKQTQPGAIVFKQHVGEASVGGLLATCLCHALEPPTTPIADSPAIHARFTLVTAGFDFHGWLPGWARPWCSMAAAATLPAMTRCQATAPRHPTASRRRARSLGARFGWPHAYATQGSNSGPAEPSTQTARHACFLPRLGQSAPDLEAAPDYKGSCCEGLRGDGSRRDEERLLLQALNVRWCAGAVERYEARQAAHFCMLKGPIEPTWHADPRQVCYAHTCSRVRSLLVGQRWWSSRVRTWSGGSHSSPGARGRSARC